MTDFEFTAAAFTVVLAACYCIVWSMVAFHRAVNDRWEWLQRRLADRDRELQR